MGIAVGPARSEQAGWIAVRFTANLPGLCGQATIGANPGLISIRTDPASTCGSSCAVSRITTDVIAHEVGHALGFSHTDSGIMKAGAPRACSTDPVFTPAERAAARLVYSRQPGNSDPDTDPIGAAYLEPRTILD